jgi:hypothetical protein
MMPIGSCWKNLRKQRSPDTEPIHYQTLSRLRGFFYVYIRPMKKKHQKKQVQKVVITVPDPSLLSIHLNGKKLIDLKPVTIADVELNKN